MMKLETEIEIAMTDNISEDLRDLLSRCQKRIKALDAALQQDAQEKSFFTFSKRLQNYVTATRDNAKGKPIDIQVLLPLLKKGWVAMDESGFWYWHKSKPSKGEQDWRTKDDVAGDLVAFNLKPAYNWEDSVMECGL